MPPTQHLLKLWGAGEAIHTQCHVSELMVKLPREWWERLLTGLCFASSTALRSHRGRSWGSCWMRGSPSASETGIQHKLSGEKPDAGEIAPGRNPASKAHQNMEERPFASSVPPAPSLMTTLNVLPVGKGEIFIKSHLHYRRAAGEKGHILS